MNLHVTLKLLQDVGFIVNWKKSSLTPSQNFLFLGLRWDTLQATLGVDDAKRIRLTTLASSMLRSTSLTCHGLQRLLGVMASQIAAVPLLRLRSRYLQRDLNLVYSSPRDGRLPVTLSSESRLDLRWIASLELHQCVALMWPIVVESCDLEVTTDASDFAWGIYFDGRLIRCRW